MPGCSKDLYDMELISQKSNTMLSPQDVRSYPKAGPRASSIKGRNKGKLRILTETPGKIRLEEEIKDREERKRRPNEKKIKKVKTKFIKLCMMMTILMINVIACQLMMRHQRNCNI
ncbi:hypothetical protein QE152_g1250 [Popillia japonica]|uniref:Uncharacterized protein n=1 Tax=Popillia japonica TaxID=7064 RepID=A0AAW1NBC7_POPJA